MSLQNTNNIIQVPLGVDGLPFGGIVTNSSSISPIPIVSKDPTYYGTINADTPHTITISSNVAGASIILNGENTFKTTNASMTWALSDILNSTITNTIELQKTGFVCTERFVISVVQNPNYNWVTPITQYTEDGVLLKTAIADSVKTGVKVLPQKMYTNVPPHIIDVAYYKNGVLTPFTGTIENGVNSSTSIEFSLDAFTAVIAPVDQTVISTPTPSTNVVSPVVTPVLTQHSLAFNVTSSNLTTSSVNIIKHDVTTNADSSLAITSGSSVYYSTFADTYTIVSSDTTLHRISSITIQSTIYPQKTITALLGESLTTTITADSDYVVSIVSEEIPTQTVSTAKTSIILTNQNVDRKYNINSNTDIPIAFVKPYNVHKVRVNVNDKQYEFKDLGDDDVCGISIPKEAYNTVGDHKTHITPVDDDDNDCEVTEIVHTVVEDYYVGIPDIFNIVYPSIIQGQDYVGTDVNFDLQWDSANTDYIRLYSGTNFIQLPAIATQVLNVKQLLGMANAVFSENDTQISFQLKLIPYNDSGVDDAVGKEEVITIKFIKGRDTIPRPVAITRIAEAFQLQFDTIDVDDEGSKYLTHLLHLGDGNNKIITTWTGSNDSVILKLYEPLPTSVDVNQLVWVSKIQSNTTIESVTLIGATASYCEPLRGPNFTVEPDNSIGFKVFDDLIASGSATSTDLLNKYSEKVGIDTKRFNIQFVSGSQYVFENFVNFSSAEERVNNFYYKLQLIENYQKQYNSSTGSSSAISGINAQSAYDSLNGVMQGFDAFEDFLYTDTTSDLSYPKVDGNPIPSTTDDALNWLDNITATASYFDKYNPNYLANNYPQYVKENVDHADFVVFNDMIGQHFDIIWMYINAMNKNKQVEAIQSKGGIINDMVFYMLESMGWGAKMAYDSEYLWEHAFGLYRDGTQKYVSPLVQANEQVWRRILYNLPYLLKHKGTARALKAAMACYGVPQSLLTIMEFGGPQNPTGDAVTQFTFEDRTCAISLDTNSSIIIPWKQVPSTSAYPECIEIRIKPSIVQNCTLINVNQFTLQLIQIVGNLSKLRLIFDSMIIDSDSFNLSTADYSQIVINRHQDVGLNSFYEVIFQTTDGTKIINPITVTHEHLTSVWEGSGVVTIGGDNYVGVIDEFRLWKVPLQTSKLDNHTLFPDAINGNSYTSSTSDLLFRLDFEYPKNRIIDPYIKNVAINTEYGATYATASNFWSAPAYPYQYIPYERVVTANVPSVGFGYANKIRFETQELIGDLSYKVRATKKSYDRGPIDSSRLGFFLSPTKELNLDILKAFGEFNIDDYIGDPSDEYTDKYAQLDELRHYYFERLDRNINEYIQLVRNIDKSLYDVLEDLSPARAKISKGLLIEPHYLERNKTKWKKVESDKGDYTGTVDAAEHTDIASTYNTEDALLDASEVATFDFQMDNYDGIITSNDVIQLDGDQSAHDANLQYFATDFMEVTVPTYDSSITVPSGASLVGEFGSLPLTAVGMEPDSLANAGYGLYANNGVGKVTTIDSAGNKIWSRQNIYLVTEQYQINVPTQVSGSPVLGALPGEQVVYADRPVTKTKHKVVTLPWDISNSITLGNGIVDVQTLNGYFPTHHKYTNNLSEGLKRSLYKGSVQSATTTPDGLPAVEIFTTNPNILKVANTGRSSGEPILVVS